MKKVLVTGAAGAIGVNVIKFLLSEGKYEITAVDLPNNRSIKRLKKYRKRVNLVYADLTDPVITDGLVKDQDYIIHLASVLPNMANLKKQLCDVVDYKMSENIIRAITFYNPNCNLLFASTTNIYSPSLSKVSVKSKLSSNKADFYSKCKLKTEKLITKTIDNYTIFRIPLVLTNPKYNYFPYNGNNDEIIEVISDIDAAYAFVAALKETEKLNKKTFNLSGGEICQIRYKDLLKDILSYYGFSFKYLLNRLLITKDYHGFNYDDGDKLNKMLSFRNDSIPSFMLRLKRQTSKRIIPKFIGRIINKIGSLKR